MSVDVPVEQIMSQLSVIPTDPSGKAIPGAKWSLAGSERLYDAGESVAVVPQEHVVHVFADGYKRAIERVPVARESQKVAEVELVPTKAEIKDGRIHFDGVIHFQTSSSLLQSRSNGLLNDVGDILNDYPAIEQIRIEGHTDSRGSHADNKLLSQRRANAVRQYLIRYGIAPHRIVAKGLGEERPIASNDTKKGRKKNRRVEIHILKVDQSKVDGVIEISLPSDID